MPGGLEACIFDLDGVLTDTADLHFKSWRRLGRELGYELSPEKNRELKGVSRAGSLDLILKWAGRELDAGKKQQLMDRKNQWYLSEIENLGEKDQLPGAASFLDQLDRNNIPYGLGSGSKNARTIVKKIGLAHRFKWVVDGTDVQKSKPDPEVFVKAANLMGCKICNTAVFEDSVAGLIAARKGGFIAVGFGTDSNLSDHADFVVENWEKTSLDEIGALIAELN
ncbi:MAG: beta-phosphoglucomutase [Saprospirales bacterium]|nr:MAG: beta-phosphoglucomutase [Saprospirales bacterium]